MDPKVMADTIWTLVTAMLVFWMNAGFGTLEAGFQPAKNCVNILSKNLVVFAASSIGFLVLGFGLMFGNGHSVFSFAGNEGLWFVGGADNSPATLDAYQGAYGSLNWTGTPLWAKFFFQLVFCGTAATIVSGAVGGRIKYFSFIVFSFIITAIIYPFVGHWIWGGGWLMTGNFGGSGLPGFLDFAGSTQVHSIGGWAALAGALMLGPRVGKYNKDGSVNPTPGHNLGLATIGTFILWLGWFGFNPGSTMAADPEAIARICVTTNTAAAAGVLGATIVSTWLLGKPDLGMALNGCIAGLVAITAPCAFVSVWPSSVIIGFVAGVLVVVSVIAFDRMHVDDPVGAISAHLTNGIWGTLSIGLFAETQWTPAKTAGLFYGGGLAQLTTQLIGIVSAGATVFVMSLIGWAIIKATMGIRVSLQEELEGLDIGEHGNSAYPDFVVRKTLPVTAGPAVESVAPAGRA